MLYSSLGYSRSDFFSSASPRFVKFPFVRYIASGAAYPGPCFVRFVCLAISSAVLAFKLFFEVALLEEGEIFCSKTAEGWLHVPVVTLAQW